MVRTAWMQSQAIDSKIKTACSASTQASNRKNRQKRKQTQKKTKTERNRCDPFGARRRYCEAIPNISPSPLLINLPPIHPSSSISSLRPLCSLLTSSHNCVGSTRRPGNRSDWLPALAWKTSRPSKNASKML